MKRKLVSVLCAATMLITMAACGKSDVQGTVTSTKDSGASTTVTVSTVVSTETSTEVSTDLSTETSAVTDTSASTETVVEEPVAESAITPGTVASNVYENKYFGCGAVLDSSWTLYDAEQQLAADEATKELLGEDYAKMIESLSVVPEFTAVGSNGIDMIQAQISVCNAAELIATEAQIIESAASQINDVFANMGITVDGIECTDITFAGADHSGAYIAYSYGGIQCYEALIVIKKGTYLYNIVFNSLNTDDLESYIKMFYEVK